MKENYNAERTPRCDSFNLFNCGSIAGMPAICNGVNMDRKDMMTQAVCCFENPELYKIKDSVFGVLRNLIKSVDGETEKSDNLKKEREIFEYILSLNNDGSKRNYMNVKLCELQDIILGLYCVKRKVLPDTVFQAYTNTDLIGYTELCRRIHKAELTGPKTAENIHKYQKKENISKTKGSKWDSGKETILSIFFALRKGDIECAEYVAKNKKSYMRKKEIIEMTEKLLNRKI
ncbi:hypothetical protein [Robinsoniella peoriensis]|uniref:hypothetical protein n=1 Tax=Robinsoniella peoriensis TaxID=180332 RepID=UPI00085BC9EB|nr:hypothetical protein [Robinsoniella peoriensis]